MSFKKLLITLSLLSLISMPTSMLAASENANQTGQDNQGNSTTNSTDTAQNQTQSQTSTQTQTNNPDVGTMTQEQARTELQTMLQECEPTYTPTRTQNQTRLNLVSTTVQNMLTIASRIATQNTSISNKIQTFAQAQTQMQDEHITDEQITDSLIASVGGGHASLATTPAIWFAIKGNASKMVDSMFTGAVYESALMPSGRRIPIAKDQIVVPLGIFKRGDDAVNLYMRTSEANIDCYERLMKEGVPKEEAAKIVQYGHRGGGFIYMPLETIVSFARDFTDNVRAIPTEGHQVIVQLKDFIREHGMEKTYFGRVNAPREGFPNPGIFHYDNNLTRIIESDQDGVVDHPIITDESYTLSQEGRARIGEFLRRRQEIFSSPESIKNNWKQVLSQLNGIVKEYNSSISTTTVANSPWRVWGEVKRHRTLRQSAESIYKATDRALEVVRRTEVFVRESKTENLEWLADEFSAIFSMPPAVKKDPEKLKYWMNRVVDSLDAYDQLRQIGVSENDAVHIIPRGIKIGIEKNFDLYNDTLGYLSLRLCNTCEPEMRKTSEQERELMMKSQMPEEVKALLTPKCTYVGFCPEGSYKKCCGKVRGEVPDYTETQHTAMQQNRKAEILHEINRGKK